MLVTKYNNEQTNIAVKTDFRFRKRLPYIYNHKLSLFHGLFTKQSTLIFKHSLPELELFHPMLYTKHEYRYSK